MSRNVNLMEAEAGETHTIVELDTEEEDMNAFLVRLGCYRGEKITLLAKTKHMCTIVIKDGRYSIDSALARSIIV